jgi:hypothetical protein
MYLLNKTFILSYEIITAVKYFESLQQMFWPLWEGHTLLMPTPPMHVHTPREVSKPVEQQITKQNPTQITEDGLNGSFLLHMHFLCLSKLIHLYWSSFLETAQISISTHLYEVS